MIVYQETRFVNRRIPFPAMPGNGGRRAAPEALPAGGGRRPPPGRTGGGAVVQNPGELLPVHHLALDGDQLPLEGQPQLPPLPAGQGEGVFGAGAVTDGAGRLEVPPREGASPAAGPCGSVRAVRPRGPPPSGRPPAGRGGPRLESAPGCGRGGPGGGECPPQCPPAPQSPEKDPNPPPPFGIQFG